MHLNMLALKQFMDRIYNHTYKVNTELPLFPLKSLCSSSKACLFGPCQIQTRGGGLESLKYSSACASLSSRGFRMSQTKFTPCIQAWQRQFVKCAPKCQSNQCDLHLFSLLHLALCLLFGWRRSSSYLQKTKTPIRIHRKAPIIGMQLQKCRSHRSQARPALSWGSG